eukprot:scaffold1525_cov142-Cylindrotheca_fusiformis.AAC.80
MFRRSPKSSSSRSSQKWNVFPDDSSDESDASSVGAPPPPPMPPHLQQKQQRWKLYKPRSRAASSTSSILSTKIIATDVPFDEPEESDGPDSESTSTSANSSRNSSLRYKGRLVEEEKKDDRSVNSYTPSIEVVPSSPLLQPPAQVKEEDEYKVEELSYNSYSSFTSSVEVFPSALLRSNEEEDAMSSSQSPSFEVVPSSLLRPPRVEDEEESHKREDPSYSSYSSFTPSITPVPVLPSPSPDVKEDDEMGPSILQIAGKREVNGKSDGLRKVYHTPLYTYSEDIGEKKKVEEENADEFEQVYETPLYTYSEDDEDGDIENPKEGKKAVKTAIALPPPPPPQEKIRSEGGKNKKRGTSIAIAMFIGLCILAALAIVIGKRNREKDATSPFEREQGVGKPVPQDCQTLVETTVPCYTTNNHTSIDVSFTMCNAEIADYVGIYQYSEDLDPNNLGNPLFWIWSCGLQNFGDCAKDVVVYFATDLAIPGTLEDGTYQVHLSHRNPGGPYVSEGASAPFNVSSTC